MTSSETDHSLTTVVPQPRHRTVNAYGIRWSQGFDRIFATRGSRVQIPSAPLKAVVRAVSD